MSEPSNGAIKTVAAILAEFDCGLRDGQESDVHAILENIIDRETRLPELLGALKLLVRSIDAGCNAEDFTAAERTAPHNSALFSARVIIAKAEARP